MVIPRAIRKQDRKLHGFLNERVNGRLQPVKTTNRPMAFGPIPRPFERRGFVLGLTETKHIVFPKDRPPNDFSFFF